MKDIIVDERAAWPRKKQRLFFDSGRDSRLSKVCNVTDNTDTWRVKWNRAKRDMLNSRSVR